MLKERVKAATSACGVPVTHQPSAVSSIFGFDKLTSWGHRNLASAINQPPCSILRTHSPSDHGNAELLPSAFPDWTGCWPQHEHSKISALDLSTWTSASLALLPWLPHAIVRPDYSHTVQCYESHPASVLVAGNQSVRPPHGNHQTTRRTQRTRRQTCSQRKLSHAAIRLARTAMLSTVSIGYSSFQASK